MPTTIAHRDLRNNSSAILRRVESGETFLVSNHGNVVAVLSPSGEYATPRIVKARKKGSLGSIRTVQASERTIDILNELRGESLLAK